jgi:hypothetical protein
MGTRQVETETILEKAVKLLAGGRRLRLDNQIVLITAI